VPSIHKRFLDDLERVLASAMRVTGDAKSAERMVCSEKIASLGGKSAATLVAEGRTSDVVCYLENIESGFVG
jgi:hypothetical protein